MKRLLIALLCSLAISLCAACGGGDPTPLLPSPAQVVSVTSTVNPAEMPTAEPFWTATSASTPATAAAATSILDPAVAARVSGVTIAWDEYERRVQEALAYLLQQPGFDVKSPAGQRALEELRKQVLDWLIDQILIKRAAEARGITVAPSQLEAQMLRIRGKDEARFKAWLKANGLDEQSLRDQMLMDLLTAAVRDDVTASLSRVVPQVHARHILLSDEAAAQRALEQLRGGANFISLARSISEDETTRPSGGDLGFLPRGVMPPAFEEAAFSTEPGQITEVVRSDFGVHIIQVLELDPKRPVPDELWPVVQQRAFDDWLAGQRSVAEIQINAQLS